MQIPAGHPVRTEILLESLFCTRHRVNVINSFRYSKSTSTRFICHTLILAHQRIIILYFVEQTN